MKNKGAIAILGGMGPAASAKMLDVMVSMVSKEFGAKEGEDFPEIIVDSIPIPDFISDKRKLASARMMLKSRVINMNKLNVSCLAMACNTAHLLVEELSAVSKVPFISMIDSVCDVVSARGLRTVGILATPSTINECLYQGALNMRKINFILPSENQILEIERIIRKIIAEDAGTSESRTLVNIASSLVLKGAQGIILGCTELPLIFPKDFSVNVFDSVELTSRTLLTRHFDGRRKNG